MCIYVSISIYVRIYLHIYVKDEVTSVNRRVIRFVQIFLLNNNRLNVLNN